MVKPLRSSNGRFTGSIGDGKTRIPTATPATPVPPLGASNATTPPYDTDGAPEAHTPPYSAAWQAYLEHQESQSPTVTLTDNEHEPVTLTKGLLDVDATWVFMNGHCHSFAFALHEVTGLPLIGLQPVTDKSLSPEEYEDWYWDPNMRYLNHLALLIDDHVLDAEGLHTLDDFAGNHNLVTFPTPVEAITEMNRINDEWGETIWKTPQPEAARTFITPALQRWAPHLIQDAKTA